MAGKLEWHGEREQARIRNEMILRIIACCKLLTSHAKQLLSIPGTSKSVRGSKRNSKGQFVKGSGKKVYGTNPSAPGDPPHKQLGHLRRSVTYETETDGLTGRVGTNLLYGLWLELGTRLMAARPWLRRALGDCREQVKALLTAPMR